MAPWSETFTGAPCSQENQESSNRWVYFRRLIFTRKVLFKLQCGSMPPSFLETI